MGFASAGHTVLSVLCPAETVGFARLEAMYCRTPLQPNNAFVRESKAVASSTIWGLSMKYHPSIQAQKNNTTCYIRERLTATQKTLSELKKE